MRQLSAWAARVGFRNKLALGLVTSAVAAGIATYAAMTRAPFFSNDPTTVSVLLTLDLSILLLLGTLVIQRIYSLWRKRLRNQAGARLHVRMVSVFALLAVAPALLVAMFATIFFYFGVEAWFSDRVRTALDESQEVAAAYLQEHQQALRADALAMANDLNRHAVMLSEDPLRFSQIISAQAYLRSLTEILVLDNGGRILAKSGLSFALNSDNITEDMLNKASAGEVVLLVSEGDDRVRALVKLDNFMNAYLFVGRLVDPKVLARINTTATAVSEYNDLKAHSAGIRMMVSGLFALVALLLLLAAVWFGLNFANRLVRPISELIAAANRLRLGDLSVRVSETGVSNHTKGSNNDDELAVLGRAFNLMAGQLEAQRSDLIAINHQLDTRRRFTEAVLSGVSAGIIGLDHHLNINLLNDAAVNFFQVKEREQLIGQPLEQLSPEIKQLVADMPRGSRLRDGQVEIRRPEQPTHTLLVRVSPDVQITISVETEDVRGYVVTFDDVSELVAAQRKAAWADVARRIAHEIKNPLTPIQLSAERLSRKYGKEITTDPEVFHTCTATIVRHVEDIGRMVDEFSAFARMPVPVMREHDLTEVCRQTFLLQSTGRPDIRYSHSLPATKFLAVCDGRQIAQALTNLMKNAAESIDARMVAQKEEAAPSIPQGEIHLALSQDNGMIKITVSDNGKGLPKEGRDRLTEPYVTTRTRGTGLGLAIVKKIMEDHSGTLLLNDREGGGASVALSWAVGEV